MSDYLRSRYIFAIVFLVLPFTFLAMVRPSRFHLITLEAVGKVIHLLHNITIIGIIFIFFSEFRESVYISLFEEGRCLYFYFHKIYLVITMVLLVHSEKFLCPLSLYLEYTHSKDHLQVMVSFCLHFSWAPSTFWYTLT